MKRVLIIGFVFMLAISLNAQDNGSEVQNLVNKINEITKSNKNTVITTELDKAKLESYVQLLGQYRKELNSEQLVAVYFAKVNLHNYWLNHRTSENLSVKQLLTYIKQNAKDEKGKQIYTVSSRDNVKTLVELVRSYISNKDGEISSEDASMMQKIFEYYVDIIERTDPMLKSIPALYEEDLLVAKQLQENMLGFLIKGEFVESLDINNLLDYSDRLLKATEIAYTEMDNTFFKQIRKSYIESMTENIKKISEFRK